MVNRCIFRLKSLAYVVNETQFRPFSTSKSASLLQLSALSTGLYRPTSRYANTTDMDDASVNTVNKTSTNVRFLSERAAAGEVKPSRVLITGGMGQLGRSLADIFKEMYGSESVILTDISMPPNNYTSAVEFRYLNVMDRRAIDEMIVNYSVDTIVHFSALLSAIGEQNVELALDVNCQGVQNILNTAKAYKLKVFIPSTIGVFGPSTPRDNTPDVTIQRPQTIYGVTKVFAELLGEYYFSRFGVDFRSLRFPGIISNVQPGGGTTDYAIKIFYDALMYGRHTCYLRPDTRLPMMYDADCMASIVSCLMAPSETLSLRTYNVTGFSFTPSELANEIRRHIPDFQISYGVCSIRQAIADSWPRSLDDSTARRDWNWRPQYDVEATVTTMLRLLDAQLNDVSKPKIGINNTVSKTVDGTEKISMQM